MHRLSLLSIVLASAALADAPPAPMMTALERALALPNVRIEADGFDPSISERCTIDRAEVPSVQNTDRVAVKFWGHTPDKEFCRGAVWLDVRLFAPTMVVQRLVRAGEPLVGAVALQEREVQPNRAPVQLIPEGAVATRTLAMGTQLSADHMRVGPGPGEPITVVLHSGLLHVEQLGTLISCGQARSCAQLPSGRRLQGELQGGALWVQLR